MTLLKHLRIFLWALLLPLFANLANCNGISSVILYQYYNGLNHETRYFESVVASSESSDLILRRANVLHLGVMMRQPFNDRQSQLWAHLILMSSGREQYLIPIQKYMGREFGYNSTWQAEYYSVRGAKVDIKLWIPADCPVGVWRLNLQLREYNRIISEVTVPNPLYILFNPWSSADEVYMPDNSDRNEYILNEKGIIYMGTFNEPEPRQWTYDQFKKTSLLAAMALLDQYPFTAKDRSQPTIISRYLSKIVNVNDDNGVVVGKWTEPYEPDRAPWEWLGSGLILEQYLKTRRPQKYGQCWVFAGVTTTLCRVLGIPARTVTNFKSAHDTDNSLTIDRFFNSYGEEVKDVNTDSVWNFHVWTEAWMARKDLGSSNFNRPHWQAIDATPQERSQGYFMMGPGSTLAVKTGDVNLHWDLPFLYSEVNADMISWVKDQVTQRWRKIDVDTYSIGGPIITKSKSINNDYNLAGDDLTLNYKFAEGSQQERDSMKQAGRIMNLKYIYDPSISLRNLKTDITFSFLIEKKQLIGDNLVISYMITNNVNKNRNVDLKLDIKSIYYSGRDGESIKKIKENILIAPKKSENFTVIINPVDYTKKAVELNLFKASAFLNVKENNQLIASEVSISLIKPKLNVLLNKNLLLQTSENVVVNLKNPFKDFPLTNCKLIGKETIINEHFETKIGNIEAGGELNHSFTAFPKKTGHDLIIIQLDCKELFDIRGHVSIDVKK